MIEGETKLILNKLYIRKPCGKCKQLVWFRKSNRRVDYCDSCLIPNLYPTTGGGRRVNHDQHTH